MAIYRSYVENFDANFPTADFFVNFHDPTSDGTRISSDNGLAGQFKVIEGSALSSHSSGQVLNGIVTSVKWYERTPDGDVIKLATLDFATTPITLTGGDGDPETNPFTTDHLSIIFGAGDQLYGGPGLSNLYGHDGDDTIFGNGGGDGLSGGIGNDLLVGGAGNDSFDGGDGDDTLWGGAIGETTADTSEDLAGGAGNDEIHLPGGGVATGQDGNDLIFGGGTAASLYGEAGQDTLIGRDTDDALDGGAGSDEIEGGKGNDGIYGDYQGDAAELHGNDLIFGGRGGDTIQGRGGDDTVYGGRGDDFITADADVNAAEQGDDILFGGAGRDVMSCGNGNDTLVGNADRDAFVFNQFFGTCSLDDFVTKKTSGHRDTVRMLLGDLGEAGDYDSFIAACTDTPDGNGSVVYDVGNDGVNRIVFLGLSLADFSRADIDFV